MYILSIALFITLNSDPIQYKFKFGSFDECKTTMQIKENEYKSQSEQSKIIGYSISCDKQ